MCVYLENSKETFKRLGKFMSKGPILIFFQPIHVSKILAKLAEQEKADMIMLGKVSIVLITELLT